MQFNICTNIDNGVGLQADAELLKGLLESWGHRVTLCHYKKTAHIEEAPRSDVNLFLEVINYGLIPKGKQNWLIPNPEWFAYCDHNVGLPQINKILCKTRDAVRIFSELYGADRVHHIGFESRDIWDPGVEKQRRFLHVAGQSRYKNSKAVAYAFAKFFDERDPAERRELIFVGAYREEVEFARDHKNVQYIQRASDSELRKLMNECMFHIIPSGTEGWGHVIHEGYGCKAVVITTDHPPMNEFGSDKELLIKPQRVRAELAAPFGDVGAYEVKAMIDKAWKLTPERIHSIQEVAREYFLKQREEFRAKFKTIVEAI